MDMMEKWREEKNYFLLEPFEPMAECWVIMVSVQSQVKIAQIYLVARFYF